MSLYVAVSRGSLPLLTATGGGCEAHTITREERSATPPLRAPVAVPPMLRGLRVIRSPFLVRAVVPRAIGPFTPALRHCTVPAAGSDKPASTEETGAKADAAKAEADAAKADAGPTGLATTSSGYDSGPGKGLVLEDDEENLPPLQFEPGVAGAAQKGVSAIVIAFGAVAFGACAWGISAALFPSATSTQVIFSEALEKVQQDPTIAYTLGTPLKGFGSGGSPGRRNAMDRWDVLEGDSQYTVVRFTVAGSQGAALVQVQVPVERKRGEFRYIIAELPQRKLVHALDLG